MLAPSFLDIYVALLPPHQDISCIFPTAEDPPRRLMSEMDKPQASEANEGAVGWGGAGGGGGVNEGVRPWGQSGAVRSIIASATTRPGSIPGNPEGTLASGSKARPTSAMVPV